ncbi:MAG: redoxin domain-containing protein [Moraxellaceae bacterium]|nr:redoxin domain-containing protein [Moraxellaceae bacterium]
MKYLKPLFISAFVALVFISSAYGVWLAQTGDRNGWAVLAAAAVPALFFGWLFIAKPARTSAHPWWLMLGGVIGLSVLNTSAAGYESALLLIGLCGFLGPQLYIQWYSRFADRESNRLATGAVMPALNLRTTEGRTVTTTEFFAGRTLWLFYRGNWCPVCVAQVRELAAHYRELEKRGVKVLMISPQSASASARLATSVSAPMTFLQDSNNDLARALGIVDETGLPMGLQALGYDSAAPMPTVILTEGGKIVWRDLTDNYRLRPEPDVFLKVLDGELP